MKKILSIIPITLFALLLLSGLGNQKCLADTIPNALDGSGLSILLIDGYDEDDTVTFTIFNFGASSDVDYSINGGAWEDVDWSGNTAQLGEFYGGSTLDFQLTIGVSTYESDDNDYATLTYSGYIDQSHSDSWDDPYYGTVMVDWSTGDNGDFQLEILTTPELYDGFAPVPIPKSLLLLGAGLVGLIGFGFRRRKAHIT